MTQLDGSSTLFHWAERKGRQLTDGNLRGSVREGVVIPVDYAIYGDVQTWTDMTINEQYRELTIRKWERTRTDSAVVSHLSAAALWNLPLPTSMPDQIHLSGYKRHRGRTSESVSRHSIAVPEADIVEIGGVRCTNLARTVIDIALSQPEDLAVMCADAAARQYVLTRVGRHPSRRDAEELAQRFRQELEYQASKRTGRRGIRQARFVVGFANWLSESPGESLSRLRMNQIGLPEPELQVEVPGPGAVIYRPDFLFRKKRIFGEFDGNSKYAVDPDVARRQILAEKEREDWIRSTMGWRCIRWRWKDVATVAAFETLARRSGLIP